MTTNHPDPTPPTSPAAVSAPLRPVEEIVQRVIDARRGMNAALIASAHRLNAPYADQPDLSPWDTTIAPRRLALSVAIEDLIESHSSLLARLRAAEETLARATSLDTLFDALLEAQYGGMRPGGEEREAVAQLAEAVQPLLRAVLAEGASR